MRPGIRAGLILSALLWSLLSLPATAMEYPQDAAALITKVDGAGVAMIRRKSGTQVAAGVDQHLSPGDRITTDGHATVDLALMDGTIVRVGLNSEYRLASSSKQNGFMSWIFELTKGSIRALVEKSPDKKNVKLRVNTPSGTMGVRGTELVFEYSPERGISTLYTIEGRVEFGAPACDKSRSCVTIETGETSSIQKGDKAPSARKLFSADEIVKGDPQRSDASQGAQTKNEAGINGSATVGAAHRDEVKIKERLALFDEMKKVENVDVKSLGDVTKMTRNASEKMATTQDEILGRSAEDRRAMHQAIQEGTFKEYVKIADDLDERVNGKKSPDILSQENSIGAALTKKFQIGKEVVKEGYLKAPEPKAAVENSANRDKKKITAETIQDQNKEIAKGAEAVKRQQAQSRTGAQDSVAAAKVKLEETKQVVAMAAQGDTQANPNEVAPVRPTETTTSTQTETQSNTQTTTVTNTRTNTQTDTQTSTSTATSTSVRELKEEEIQRMREVGSELSNLWKTTQEERFSYWDRCFHLCFRFLTKNIDGKTYRREEGRLTTKVNTRMIVKSKGKCYQEVKTCKVGLKPCTPSRPGGTCTPEKVNDCSSTTRTVVSCDTTER